MAIDPNIYQNFGQQNTLGQLAGSINQFTETRGRLADLARQRDLQAAALQRQNSMQDRTMSREDEQYAQQQSEIKRVGQDRIKKEYQLKLVGSLRAGESIDQTKKMTMDFYVANGIPTDNVDSKLGEIYSSPLGVQAQANLIEESAYPDVASKQRMEQRFAVPKPLDEGSPVTIMKNGKPVTIMSKGGRIVGDAVPAKALVNIGLEGPAPKVSPGTRIWKEDGEWKTEVMKGTPQWQTLKSKESVDRAFVQNIVPSMAKNVIDIENLTEHKGFDNIFGKLGSIEKLDFLPETLEARAQLDQVVGAMETAGMQMQKSTAGSAGSMSQQEWPKMQTYLNLVKTATTPSQAKDALAGAINSYKRMQEVGKESYMNEWGSGQFGDPTVIDRLHQPLKRDGQAGRAEDKEAIAWANANPNDPRAIAILKANAR